jgi:3',5'-cyclic AMP phosphodiesterase CpdA
MQVTTANGITRIPIGTGRWGPTSVEGEGPVVVAAVGDGAGGMPGATQVSTMLAGWNPDMLLYLGDVYNTGSYTEFLNFYAPTFGRMKSITNPVPGDHEGGKQFQGFRDYWDSNQTYYSATAGSWRVIALDSTERLGQLTPGTVQFEWLRAELAADADAGCTLVSFHDPRWGLDQHTDHTRLDPVWRLLAAEGVDVVLDGNEHNYQRWQPLDADGQPDPAGITEFVVGTGGHEQMKLGGIDARVAAAYQTDGALRLELEQGQAQFTYEDTTGNMLDAGSIGCDGPPAAPVASDAPAPATTGTVVNTGGIGVRCRAAPNVDAEIIAVLPEQSKVELRGGREGDWQPVRCAGRDGYVFASYVAPDG